MKTSQSSAPIAELPSLSALRNKSISQLKAIPTIPSAAPHAAKPGSQNATEVVAITQGLDAKCSPQYVPSVAKTRKYHLSLVKADQCIVEIATVQPNPADNAGLVLRAYIGRNTWLMYALAEYIVVCYVVRSFDA